jgi:hypothetical protein
MVRYGPSHTSGCHKTHKCNTVVILFDTVVALFLYCRNTACHCRALFLYCKDTVLHCLSHLHHCFILRH